MDLRKNDKIFVENSIIRIESFYAFNHLVNGKEFDLNSPEFDKYRGGILRIWIDNDYNLTTERNPSQVWLLIEIPVPRREYETIETDEADEEGNSIMQQIGIPTEINEADCNIYQLPKAR